MFIPEREDLYLALKQSFIGLINAAGLYHDLAAFIANPGLDIDQEKLDAFYAGYIERRQAVIDNFHAGLAHADQTCATVMAAVVATEGQTPPLLHSYAGRAAPGEPPTQRPSGMISLGGVTAADVGEEDNQHSKKPSRRRQEPKEVELKSWNEAVNDIHDALDLLEEMPSNAEDFATSVEGKLRNMESWILERRYVTDKQLQAIANMQRGINRWLRR